MAMNGLNIAKYNDIKVGDVVEAYEEVEVNRNFSRLLLLSMLTGRNILV